MSDYPCTCRSSVVCLSCEAAWNARWARCHDDLMELGRINGTAGARQLDAAERERDEARAEIARLTAEVERLRAERNAAHRSSGFEVERLTAEVERLAADWTAATGERANLAAQEAAAQGAIKRLQAEVERLRADVACVDAWARR